MPPHPANLLTSQQIDEALTLLARRNGNAKRTAQELGERGIKVDRITLGRWKTGKYADRYLDISSALSSEDKDRAIVQGFREALSETQDIAGRLREKLSDNLDAIEPKDIPKSLQSLAIVQGVTTEKTLLLEGRPTAIQETRNPDWYEQQLAARLEEPGIDGTAEEITDADVIPESTSE